MAAFALDLGHHRGQSRTAAEITRSAGSLRRSQPRPCRAACPQGTDPALAARLFTAGLYGLMAQWHPAPGSFCWDAAAAALAGGPAPVTTDGAIRRERGGHRPATAAK
jgi:hypothetical protein